MPAPGDDRANAEPVTVLNVDDDAGSRSVVTDILRENGFAVVEAAGGLEALARLTPAIDLVILDLHLPDLSGLEVCRRIKAHAELGSTPVLMVSGLYTTGDDRSGGLESGADAYLTKPLGIRELLASVNAALRARRGEEEARQRERAMQEAQDELASALLGATLDLDEILGRVGRIGRALLAVGVVQVRLIERDGELRLAASSGETRRADLDGGGRLAAAIQRAAEPLAVVDARDCPFLDRDPLDAEGIASVLGIPLLIGAEHVGVLTCWSRVRRDWSLADVAGAQTLARQASVAIRNARLYEESQAARAEAEEAARRMRDLAIERSRVAEELGRSEARYRALVTNMPGVAWSADRNGVAVSITPRVERLLGYTPEEVYRLGPAVWFDRIGAGDVGRVRGAYRALFADGTPFDVEYRYQRKDGRWIWLHGVGELLIDVSGPPLAYGVFEDVTERKHAARIRELLLNQVITVQEEERKRLARELHDDTAQALASLRVGLEALQAARTLRQAREHARRLHDIATETLREVRRIAGGLHPRILDDLGLLVALERYATDLGTSRGLAVEVRSKGWDGRRLPPILEIALFRIVQEALANVVRHAGAQRASIVLERTETAVVLGITDDGRGFDVPEVLRSAGADGRFGLHNVRERAAALQGTSEIRSAPGRGTEIVVEIPLPPGTP